MLAIAYLTDEKRTGIRSIVLCAPCVSVSEWGDGIQRDLMPRLPEDVRKTIEDCERSGDYASAAYRNAVTVFYEKHLCKPPWPNCMEESNKAGEASPVYNYMWGPSEFTFNGTLNKAELATSENFAKIHPTVPTLWTCGEDDECRPSSLEKFHKLKNGPRDRVYVFLGASHCHHIESEDEFVQVVGGFIAEADRS
jgi:proline-specific peptidase